jgi:8-oxo-dGTP pyrophosphatase MutT (NUDIX family)
MKEGTPAWSVVVVVFKGARGVLAITRNFNPRDPSLPGGDSELEDETPAQTAKRELFEETGLQATELRCMEQWVGERGQPVFGFFAAKWKGSRLRTSAEGKPFWATPQRLIIPSATYRKDAQRLLHTLGRVKAAAT